MHTVTTCAVQLLSVLQCDPPNRVVHGVTSSMVHHAVHGDVQVPYLLPGSWIPAVTLVLA
jgi:hypothetical protein